RAYAKGISEDNQIVGYGDTTGAPVALHWSSPNANPTKLNASGNGAFADGVNSKGEIVGLFSYWQSPSGSAQSASFALFGINDASQVVGGGGGNFSFGPARFSPNLDGSAAIELPGGSNSVLGITNSGLILGSTIDNNGVDSVATWQVT